MPLNLNRILTFEDLLRYVPKLVSLYYSLDGRWEPELNEEEFVAELIRLYGEKSYFYADIVDGKLAYFAAIVEQDEKRLFFWLFYMNPDFRTETKQILTDIKIVVKEAGYKVCYTSSTRTESSYERWLEKFGAKKVSITYKFDI